MVLFLCLFPEWAQENIFCRHKIIFFKRKEIISFERIKINNNENFTPTQGTAASLSTTLDTVAPQCQVWTQCPP